MTIPEIMRKERIGYIEAKKRYEAEVQMAVPSTALFDVLVAIVNTAQDNPDRCMADVCNDNFIAHNLPLTAVMTGSEYNRIKIINTSNAQVERRAPSTFAPTTG